MIIFTHIPKTAGVTLNSIIKKNYQESEIFHGTFVSSLSQFAETILAQQQAKMIAGHIGFGFHRLLSRPCNYITMLREPLERTCSEYNYYHEHYRNANNLIPIPDLNIELPAISWEDFCQKVSPNLMTRYLSGIEFEYQLKMNSYLGFSLAKILNRDNSLQEYFEYPPQKMLEKAKKNLKNNYLIFGLTEKFEDSLKLFESQLSWQDIKYNALNKSNKPTSLESFTEQQINYARKSNELDIELYQYAQNLFESKLSKLNES